MRGRGPQNFRVPESTGWGWSGGLQSHTLLEEFYHPQPPKALRTQLSGYHFILYSPLQSFPGRPLLHPSPSLSWTLNVVSPTFPPQTALIVINFSFGV